MNSASSRRISASAPDRRRRSPAAADRRPSGRARAGGTARSLKISSPRLSAGWLLFAFSAASIFRLGFFIIVSVYHDGADPAPIKPPVPKSGAASPTLVWRRR